MLALSCCVELGAGRTLFAGQDLEQERHVLFILPLDGLGKLLGHNPKQLRMGIEVLGKLGGRVIVQL